jgi:hypothetical protein
LKDNTKVKFWQKETEARDWGLGKLPIAD